MKNFHFAWVLPLVLFSVAFSESSAQNPGSDWKSSFINPPDQYRPVPFWHINGKLTAAEIEKQVEAAKSESGYGIGNVNNRIRLYYGKQFGLSLQSAYNTGTCVTLVIPAKIEIAPQQEVHV